MHVARGRGNFVGGPLFLGPVDGLDSRRNVVTYFFALARARAGLRLRNRLLRTVAFVVGFGCQLTLALTLLQALSTGRPGRIARRLR